MKEKTLKELYELKDQIEAELKNRFKIRTNNNLKIYKIQIPLASNDKNAPALVYCKDKLIEFTLPIHLVKEFMGGELKKFAYIYLEGNEWGFQEAEWQSW